MAHSYTFPDGRHVEWTGAGISICTQCQEIFNSVAAFDYHLKRKRGKGGGIATHDITGMPRNKRGYLVITLFDDDTVIEEGEDDSPVVCPQCHSDLRDGDLYHRTTCPYCGEDWASA